MLAGNALMMPIDAANREQLVAGLPEGLIICGCADERLAIGSSIHAYRGGTMRAYPKELGMRAAFGVLAIHAEHLPSV